MHNDWDSYFCEVEDKPASIVVNLGLAEEADEADFPSLCYVSIFFKEPDKDGFPADSEEGTIAAMEDALMESFHAPDTGRCAGHCLTNGKLDIFFYLESGENWPDNAAAVLDHFPSHKWEAGSHYDPDWELYFGFLYPDEVCMLHIQNRRACDRLEELGDDLSISRRLEHWAVFPAKEKAETYASMAKEMGYTLEGFEETVFAVEDDGNGASDDRQTPPAWQVRLSRPDCPEDSDEVSLLLFGLAREQGGEYMGWSCTKLKE